MKRRTLALALGGILLATAVATAVVLLGPPRVPLTRSASDVDHVTLYQNGLAFIELTRRFESNGGESLLVLPLPASARVDSVELDGDGVEIHEIRSSVSSNASLREGDEITIHAGESGIYRGVFSGREGGSLVLTTEDGIALVDESNVVAIEIAGRPAAGLAPGTIELVARVVAPAGDHAVHVSYLAQGPGWSPSYALDVTSGNVSFYASLTGLDDWRNVTLDLVSGSPNILLQPSPPIPYATRAYEAGIAMDVAKADEVAPSTPLGELHRYRYERPLEVSRGETVRLLIEQGDLEVLRDAHVVEAQTGYVGVLNEWQRVDVRERLEFRNTLGEPLPPGRVLAYRDGTWIGEDMMPATPKGERGNVTLATSFDVIARLTLEESRSDGTRDTYAYALTIQNRKDSSIDLRATLSYPTYRTTLLGATPPPDESTGGSATWNEAIPAGGEATFRIHYETLRP